MGNEKEFTIGDQQQIPEKVRTACKNGDPLFYCLKESNNVRKDQAFFVMWGGWETPGREDVSKSFSETVYVKSCKTEKNGAALCLLQDPAANEYELLTNMFSLPQIRTLQDAADEYLNGNHLLVGISKSERGGVVVQPTMGEYYDQNTPKDTDVVVREPFPVSQSVLQNLSQKASSTMGTRVYALDSKDQETLKEIRGRPKIADIGSVHFSETDDRNLCNAYIRCIEDDGLICAINVDAAKKKVLIDAAASKDDSEKKVYIEPHSLNEQSSRIKPLEVLSYDKNGECKNVNPPLLFSSLERSSLFSGSNPSALECSGIDYQNINSWNMRGEMQRQGIPKSYVYNKTTGDLFVTLQKDEGIRGGSGITHCAFPNRNPQEETFKKLQRYIKDEVKISIGTQKGKDLSITPLQSVQINYSRGETGVSER